MEQVIADCLEDYHRRRALNEPANAEDYVERLGEQFDTFIEVLSMEDCLDRAVNQSQERALPQPFGDYTLMRELGRGTNGIVYEALHRPLGRTVAVKVLRTGFDTEPVALRRFRHEAMACAQVRHDHIIEIYEAGDVDGRPYYAMPLLVGESLSSLIRAGRAPGPRDLCRGLAGIADALAALHERGIVHRDVKSGNILVDAAGRMILADFGLARTASSLSLTRTGQALGTPLYMSPEQLFGRQDEIDGRSDVYGLGVTLYETLSGRPPYRAQSYRELMHLLITSRPRPLADGLSPDAKPCGRIAMKAIEHRKKDRYPTAAAMRDDLLAFVEERPVVGRPISPARHVARRHGRVLAIATGVLVLVSLLGWWWWTQPGTIDIAPTPAAMVFVDGEEQGWSPMVLELPPGRYEVVLRRDVYQDVRQVVSLSAGDPEEIKLPLAVDLDHPRALEVLRQLLGVDDSDLDPPEVMRGMDGEPFEPILPRGDVRMADLGRYRVELYEGKPAKVAGVIEFRRGEEVLGCVPYDAAQWVTEGEIPAAVRRALAPGDTVTWGIVPGEGEPVWTTFRVLTVTENEKRQGRLDRFEKAAMGQPEALVGPLRARLLYNLGLHAAAIAEGREHLGDAPGAERTRLLVFNAMDRLEIGSGELSREVEDE